MRVGVHNVFRVARALDDAARLPRGLERRIEDDGGADCEGGRRKSVSGLR